MPRPRKCRHVAALPAATFFKPQGVPLRELEVVALTIDGLEALRHADHEGLGHEVAAEKMGVSQPTFSRLLGEARRAVAAALVGGHALQIEGGNFRLTGDAEPCRGRHGHHGHHGHHGDGHGHCGHHHHQHGRSASEEAEIPAALSLEPDRKEVPSNASEDD